MCRLTFLSKYSRSHHCSQVEASQRISRAAPFWKCMRRASYYSAPEIIKGVDFSKSAGSPHPESPGQRGGRQHPSSWTERWFQREQSIPIPPSFLIFTVLCTFIYEEHESACCDVSDVSYMAAGSEVLKFTKYFSKKKALEFHSSFFFPNYDRFHG